jgi:hypothetical protein
MLIFYLAIVVVEFLVIFHQLKNAEHICDPCCHLVSISPIFYEQLFHAKVFCTAFMCLQFGFIIFWRKDFGAKAAHKMLVKLTPSGRNWQLISTHLSL